MKIQFDVFRNFCIFRNMSRTLSKTEETFILHWGQMGTQWGINRTVAQVHALLYLSDKPLNAEEICEILNVARSNVSTSLKELVGWGIVKKTAILGDKRDHFESVKDVWELAKIISSERKKREIDPTIEVIHQCIRESEGDEQTPESTRERLKNMAEFLETSVGAFDRLHALPTPILKGMMKVGGKSRNES